MQKIFALSFVKLALIFDINAKKFEIIINKLKEKLYFDSKIFLVSSQIFIPFLYSDLTFGYIFQSNGLFYLY